VPEGDTLYRVAATLRPVLAGKVVRAVRSPLPAIADADLVGQRIEGVESRGKNLLVTFGDGRVLHTHLQMTGSWHLYRPGVPFRKPEWGIQVLLEVDGAVAVCFHAPIVRLLAKGGAERDPALASLGPDCLAPDFDPASTAARIRQTGMALGEALLYQRAVSGIGNVYKSETLFLERLDPFSRVGLFDLDTLTRALARASELMKANVERTDAPGEPFRYRERTTRAAGGAWVYGRYGEPCRVCSTPIARRYQGLANRSTYYCPQCQPPGAGTRA
jgi:endonuclease-8